MNVELPKRNGLPNMCARSRSGERNRSSFLSDLFYHMEVISRDGNLILMPFNQGEPRELQPINFFLVHSSMVEKRSHPSPTLIIPLQYWNVTWIVQILERMPFQIILLENLQCQMVRTYFHV
jgi:hypothetical protein